MSVTFSNALRSNISSLARQKWQIWYTGTSYVLKYFLSM